MEQTAIQAGAPLTKADTSIQAGAPPGAKTDARQKEVHPVVRVLLLAADLRITVFLFVLAMLLVFWGTLAQRDTGVFTVMQKYFRNPWIAWIPLKHATFDVINVDTPIPFPGGWLIGGAMMINLLAAHAVRFKLAWNRTGIIITHTGIVILMVGELVTGIFAIEGSMNIPVGQTVKTVTHPTKSEFTVIRTLDPKQDEVVTVPAANLRPGATIDDPKLPFTIEVIDYMVNSKLLNFKDGMSNPATTGFGRVHVALSVPEVNGIDPNQMFDAPSTYLKLTDRDGKVKDTWLFSTLLSDPQWVEFDGKKYQLLLRFKQTTRKNFSFHLTKFEHKVFPGTNTPKDFHSYIRLIDKENGVDRDVEIFMNNPLFYEGETFYQSSWTTDPLTREANGTILQVVHNPGWILPYASCFTVAFGLLLHFGITLHRFIRRIIR